MDASHRGRYSDFDARAGGGGGGSKSSLTIEPSGSDGHRGFAAESRGSGGSGGKRSLTGSLSIYSLDVDLLCTIFSLLDHFDLVRCSVVCKAWYHVVYTSSLMRDLYEKRNSCIKLTAKSLPLEISTKFYLGELAMEEHKLSFRRASAKVDQWNGHHTRVNICRMKRGVVLSGVGDKIVGLTNSKLCIWRRHGQRGIFQSHEGVFTRGLCMSYIDPEAVIGCEDGRVRVFDMYSGKCSRIFRVHSGPVTCLALTDDQLIIGGSTFGNIAVVDLTSGERLGFARSNYCPTGLKTLSYNTNSHLLFAGSTSGYAHCWDIRTMRSVWETRVSPNVIYSVHHLSIDTSTLAVGGLDGVLRILDQRTGEILSSLVMDDAAISIKSAHDNQKVSEKKARSLPQNACLYNVPRSLRPPITCLSVGMKKIVTTHNEKFIRIWRFQDNI
ncbi:F-box/WD-40 repeat-containing protein At3g52030-like isoform X3 [Zingiber officinale]|uniref:F-box/WD-40 repeat-containing protein At3g52030-like isoform X3 n=1 Tax=Zingiber officinale TaxID=94328 RepID=UPI001C4D5DFB|nr:F-box/WD-40 repeat-containing protein At3g52030-like isoform X3 [Zingiber officinale]